MSRGPYTFLHPIVLPNRTCRTRPEQVSLPDFVLVPLNCFLQWMHANITGVLIFLKEGTFMNMGKGKQFALEHSVSRIIPSCGVFQALGNISGVFFHFEGRQGRGKGGITRLPGPFAKRFPKTVDGRTVSLVRKRSTDGRSDLERFALQG